MAYVAGSRTLTQENGAQAPLNFRAIIAGWLVATGVAGLLYVGGLALGFSSFDVWHAEVSAKGIGIGTAIWVIVTWVVALLLGGLFASWFDDRDDQTSGALQGITVWGLSVAATGLWLALGLAHATQGHPAHPGPGMAMVGNDNDAIAVLDADIWSQFHGSDTHDRAVVGPIVGALIAGHDLVASSLLAADIGTSPSSAAQILQHLAPEISRARVAAKEAADRAAHYTAITLWIAFISSFLALAAAAIGGWLGAGHIQRVYHLRDYANRTLR